MDLTGQPEQHLSDLLKKVRSAPTLRRFLREACAFGEKMLSCQGSAVFLMDSARAELREEILHADASDPSVRRTPVLPRLTVSLDPAADDIALLFRTKEPRTGRLPIPGRQNEPPAWAVQFPVTAFGVPVALFHFTWPGEVGEQDRASAIRSVKEALCAPGFAEALLQARLQEARCEIGRAAGKPGMLREHATKFVENFVNQLKAEDRAPSIVMLNLVDHRRKLVRPLVTRGRVPTSFRTIPPRRLDSSDIQAEIVRERHAELIVGNDPRFDEEIYTKYTHEQYVRLWMPLFPVPYPWVEELHRGGRKMRDFVAWEPVYPPDHPSMEPPKQLRKVSRWKTEFKPDSALVFATLEIGYERTNPDSLDMEPLNDELADRCMKWVWEQCNELYPATIFGALDSIGQIATSVTLAKEAAFTCYLRRSNTLVHWPYPAAGPWPASVPEQVPNAQYDEEDFPKFEILRAPDILSEEDATAWHIFRRTAEEAMKPEIYQAAHTVFRIEGATTRPDEVQEPEERDDRFGTLGTDEAARAICKEAYMDTRARSACLMRLEPVSGKGGHKQVWKPYGRAVRWPEERTPREQQQEEQELALRAASSGCLEIEEGKTGPIAALPLELADETLCVLVLLFPPGPYVSRAQNWIESRSGAWVHRLSRRRMLLTDRFSTLLASLRRKIADDRKRFEKRSDEEVRADRFVQEILTELTTILGARATIFTHQIHARTGPKATIRAWCFPLPNSTPKVFWHTETGDDMSSLCRKSCETGELRQYVELPDTHDEVTLEEIQRVFERARDAVDVNKQPIGEDEAAQIFERRHGPWTFLTVPVIRGGMEPGSESAALSLLLTGAHWLRRRQRRAVEELGSLIGDALRTIQLADQRAAELRNQTAVEQRCSDMSSASTLDAVTEALLGKQQGGDHVKGPPGQVAPPWPFMGRVVVWVLSRDYKELELLSAGGDRLDGSLIGTVAHVIPAQSHPLIRQEKYKLVIPKGMGAKNKDGLYLSEKFQPRVFELPVQQDPICQAYFDTAKVNWVLSFPVVHSSGKVYGVVDCLCADPPTIAEDAVITPLLQRLSATISVAVERSRLRRSKKFAEALHTYAAKLLHDGKADGIYMKAVELVKSELTATRVDLYLKQFGKMTLLASTGLNPAQAAESCSYECNQEIAPALAGIIHAGQETLSWLPSLEKATADLKPLLEADTKLERIACSFQVQDAEGNPTAGVLYAAGRPRMPSANPSKHQKGVFTAEHLRLISDLCEQLQRVVQTVQLAELQRSIYNELVHSLGQPLQMLRNSTSNYVSFFTKNNLWNKEAQRINKRVHDYFKMVKLAHEQLGFMVRKNTHAADISFIEQDLVDIVKKVSKLMEPACYARGNSIDFESTVKQWYAPMEASWMKFALVNLIENAVKYSYARKSVSVTMSEVASDDTIVIEITNFGIGIPKEGLEPSRDSALSGAGEQLIFQRYYRSAVRDKHGVRPGMGVGLAIVRDAVRIHGGSVRAESVPVRRIQPQDLSDNPYRTTFTIRLDRKELLRRQARSGTPGSKETDS